MNVKDTESARKVASTLKDLIIAPAPKTSS